MPRVVASPVRPEISGSRIGRLEVFLVLAVLNQGERSRMQLRRDSIDLARFETSRGVAILKS